MKKLVLVLALSGVSIFNSSFSQTVVNYGDYSIDYGRFKFEEKKNDISQIEKEILNQLLLKYPNVKETSSFESIFSKLLNTKGLVTMEDITGEETPTEITSIIFPKDEFSNEQVARESVIILNELFEEHDKEAIIKIKKSELKEYRAELKIEDDNLKVVIMINK